MFRLVRASWLGLRLEARSARALAPGLAQAWPGAQPLVPWESLWAQAQQVALRPKGLPGPRQALSRRASPQQALPRRGALAPSQWAEPV